MPFNNNNSKTIFQPLIFQQVISKYCSVMIVLHVIYLQGIEYLVCIMYIYIFVQFKHFSSYNLRTCNFQIGCNLFPCFVVAGRYSFKVQDTTNYSSTYNILYPMYNNNNNIIDRCRSILLNDVNNNTFASKIVCVGTYFGIKINNIIIQKSSRKSDEI